MTKNEYRAILAAVCAAIDVTQNLACPEYPYVAFADKEVWELFCYLTKWSVKLYKKIEEAE